jgi:chromosome partitioning protein
MAVVITVMNMKGGVGKSTVAAHLGGALSLIEKRDGSPRNILLIDYDPQFNLSQVFLPAQTYFRLEKAGKTVLSILQEDLGQLNPFKIQVPTNSTPPKLATLVHRCLAWRGGGTLDLIPSSLDLMYVAVGSASGNVKTIEARYAAFISEARQKYDAILIDCHPAGSILTKTSLANSDDVLIPVVTHQYAARGIGLMKSFITASRPSSPPDMHVLFNMTARRGVSDVEAAIRADAHYGRYCLAATLKWYKGFADAHEGKAFVWSSKKAYSTEAWRNLYSVGAEVAQRMLVPRGV